MIVSPELMSASSAPSASPLKSCETKFGQLIMTSIHGRRPSDTNKAVGSVLCPRHSVTTNSGVVAEMAAEGIRFLHQAFAGHDFDDVVIIFLVFHVLFHLAPDDDDGADALVIFRAVVDVTDE